MFKCQASEPFKLLVNQKTFKNVQLSKGRVITSWFQNVSFYGMHLSDLSKVTFPPLLLFIPPLSWKQFETYTTWLSNPNANAFVGNPADWIWEFISLVLIVRRNHSCLYLSVLVISIYFIYISLFYYFVFRNVTGRLYKITYYRLWRGLIRWMTPFHCFHKSSSPSSPHLTSPPLMPVTQRPHPPTSWQSLMQFGIIQI